MTVCFQLFGRLYLKKSKQNRCMLTICLLMRKLIQNTLTLEVVCWILSSKLNSVLYYNINIRITKYLLQFQSGAKINISDALSAERIVTFTGTLEQIRIAFNLMCIKFEDVGI